MRTLAGLFFFAAGCGLVADVPSSPPANANTVPLVDAASPKKDAGIQIAPRMEAGLASPDASIPTACLASNYLDWDSFDVVNTAINGCLHGDARVTCTHQDESLSLSNLPEGVGPITFNYADLPDGTHTLVGHGIHVSAPTGIVFKATQIPSSITFENALESLYAPAGPVSFQCTWM